MGGGGGTACKCLALSAQLSLCCMLHVACCMLHAVRRTFRVADISSRERCCRIAAMGASAAACQQDALIQVAEEDDVVAEARDAVHRRHADDEREQVVDERVQRFVPARWHNVRACVHPRAFGWACADVRRCACVRAQRGARGREAAY